MWGEWRERAIPSSTGSVSSLVEGMAHLRRLDGDGACRVVDAGEGADRHDPVVAVKPAEEGPQQRRALPGVRGVAQLGPEPMGRELEVRHPQRLGMAVLWT